MLSGKQLNVLAEQSYWVEENRTDVPYHPEEKQEYFYDRKNVHLGKFQVLKVEDNQSNGMQAMAVVPVLNGIPDYNNITITYAGTNFSDMKDVMDTDVRQVVFGAKSGTLAIQYDGYEPKIVYQETQLESALRFAKEIQMKYPHATIKTTGHSLGGYLAIYVSAKQRWKTVTFNAPIPHLVLSEEDKNYVRNNRNDYIAYKLTGDLIGNTTGDDLGISRFIDMGDKGNDVIHYLHALSTYRYDIYGNIVDKYGELVSPETAQIPVDINLDGVIDTVVSNIDIRPKNLFSVDMRSISEGVNIQINTDTLNVLYNNLNHRITEYEVEMLRLTKLCCDKNHYIQNQYSQRTISLSKSIEQTLKGTFITSLLYLLHDSLGWVIKNKHIIEQASQKYNIVTHDLSDNEPLYVLGEPLFNNGYGPYLHHLRNSANKILNLINNEKSYGFSNLWQGESTVLKTFGVVDQTLKELIEKSEQVFIGEGLREGKIDGFSSALSTVLNQIYHNTSELFQQLRSVSQTISSVATNFEYSDNKLGQTLEKGVANLGISLVAIPLNYRAYLERHDIFDDVKDVIQAFDKQIEVRSREYSNVVKYAYIAALRQFEQSLNVWKSEAESLKNAVKNIEGTFNYLVTKRQVSYNNLDTVVTDISYSRMKNQYPANLVNVLNELKENFFSRFDDIDKAFLLIHDITLDIHYIGERFKPLIEMSVYQNYDLDEIVKAQRMLALRAIQIKQEIDYVINIIDSNNMSSHSISVLKNTLFDTSKLVSFYTQFINDCFGDNENSSYVTPSGGGNKRVTFSLN